MKCEILIPKSSDTNNVPITPTLTIEISKILYPLEGDIFKELSKVTSCSAPCWNSIVVGESTYAEINEILKRDITLQISEPTNIEGESVLEIRRLFLSENNTEATEWISFTLNGGLLEPKSVVKSITFQGFPQKTLAEWINVFGEPSHVYGFIDTDPTVGDQGVWVLRLVWLSQGVEIYTSKFVPAPSINENLLIGDQLILFEPTLASYNAAIYQNNMEDYLTLWVGYGTFEQYVTDLGE
jgi:hypothetical protein